MATQQKIERGDGHTHPAISPVAEPPVGDLLKQLGTDGAALVRSEMALAKLEMRAMAREVAADSAKLFSAIAIAMTGVLALIAAAVIALGNALDGRYALSALIVGAVMLLVGGLFARSGMAGLKEGRSPRETLETLKDTKQWASHEIRDFKQEIRA